MCPYRSSGHHLKKEHISGLNTKIHSLNHARAPPHTHIHTKHGHNATVTDTHNTQLPESHLTRCRPRAVSPSLPRPASLPVSLPPSLCPFPPLPLPLPSPCSLSPSLNSLTLHISHHQPSSLRHGFILPRPYYAWKYCTDHPGSHIRPGPDACTNDASRARRGEFWQSTVTKPHGTAPRISKVSCTRKEFADV